MSEATLKSELRVVEVLDGGPVIIEGDLTSDNAAQFERQLGALQARFDRAMILDLSGLDIDDGVALAATINALRGLGKRSAKLILMGAPQILCHNLYRVGLLGGSRAVELIDMRFDEPAGF